MRIPIYQIDAFTTRRFSGNPAAVCPLQDWLPDATMQAIAAENNLAETAFFVPQGDGYLLRWFTPAVEVELCGHATLASGYVVTRIIAPKRRSVVFDTLRAGPLEVTRDGELLAMDFPAWPVEAQAADPRVPAALGRAPAASYIARGRTLAVYDHAEDVAALRPDFAAIRRVAGASVIATAPGRAGIDFVSRYFAPNHGVDEDPVTGSAHCVLTPYWAARLGKERLNARQISARGGDRMHAARRPHHPCRRCRALPRRHDYRLGREPRARFRDETDKIASLRSQRHLNNCHREGRSDDAIST